MSFENLKKKIYMVIDDITWRAPYLNQINFLNYFLKIHIISALGVYFGQPQ